jgi:hypothetical protein
MSRKTCIASVSTLTVESLESPERSILKYRRFIMRYLETSNVVVVVPVIEKRTVDVSEALAMTRTPSDSSLRRFWGGGVCEWSARHMRLWNSFYLRPHPSSSLNLNQALRRRDLVCD